MAIDPLKDYMKDYKSLTTGMFKEPRPSADDLIDKYEQRIRSCEHELKQSRQALHIKDKQLMSQQIDKWRTTIEELGKLEALLNECIAHEKNLIGTEGMGWPGRLDQMMGEVARYRETLMRRIANKALERLAPSLETQGSANGGS